MIVGVLILKNALLSLNHFLADFMVLATVSL